jgi:hypothetical protein
MAQVSEQKTEQIIVDLASSDVRSAIIVAAKHYGRVGKNRKILWAHRVMCELVNGPCPPDHEAAHSCGRGKFGCVHPKHLSWKTRTHNQLDRAQHGTKSLGYYKHRPKLTPDKVREIRDMKGTKTQREIATQFGVTDATIRDIYAGKSWAHVQ